ncbi:MAG TPA: pentapeptide repeat-containing protein [Stellaceae bacterium]|nr:pentapeptide repeat-containing protein [Stellaceae bacterium]
MPRPEAFPSLAALRSANDSLLESFSGFDSNIPTDQSASTEAAVVKFVRQAAATGALLDLPSDRRIAQAAIDYWVASAFTADTSNETRSTIRRSRLEPFNSASVLDAAKEGNLLLNGLRPSERELLRQILMRFIRIPETGERWISLPATRQSLISIGNARRNRAILERLEKSGIIRVSNTDQDDSLELQSEALGRQWEPLFNWIEERVRLRYAAEFWEQSGCSEKKLLSGGLAQDAGAYCDLTPAEMRFIAASKSRANRKARATRAMLVALLLALAFIGVPYLLTVPAIKRTFVATIHEELTQSVKSSHNSSYRALSIQFLAWLPQQLVLNNANDLSNLDLRGLSVAVPAPIFSNSMLTNVNLSSSTLAGALFDQTVIKQSHFDSATLPSVHFEGADIEGTTFVRANLTDSSFDGARFRGDVDFSSSDLSRASFRGVGFVDDNLPNFTGVAWWRAIGLDIEQIPNIARRYPVDAYAKSAVFKGKRQKAEDEVTNSPARNFSRGRALNDLAWMLAVTGVDLDVAQSYATEALEITRDPAIEISRDLPRELVVAVCEDTLAYILLERGDLKNGAELELKAMAAGSKTNARGLLGSVQFRYAVALYALGQKPDAFQNLKVSIVTLAYSPSHELLTMNRYFDSEFREEYKRLVAAPPSSRSQ